MSYSSFFLLDSGERLLADDSSHLLLNSAIDYQFSGMDAALDHWLTPKDRKIWVPEKDQTQWVTPQDKTIWVA